MPSINEVLERVSRVRPSTIDDQTKAAWLIELDGKLYREVVLRHEGHSDHVPLQHFPEDGDKPLLVDSPHDNMYDLYLFAQIDLYNREGANYNVSAAVYNAALDDWKSSTTKRTCPKTAAI